MVYLRDGGLVVRDLQRPDADAIAAAELAQGWANASPEKYLMRLADRDAGRAIHSYRWHPDAFLKHMVRFGLAVQPGAISHKLCF